MPIHQLQQILGHQSINVTLRYLHWLPTCEGKAADLLAFLPKRHQQEAPVDEQF